MKKILSFMLALMLALTLAGCGGAASAPAMSTASVTSAQSSLISSAGQTPSLSPSADSLAPDSAPPISEASGNYNAIAAQLKTLTDNADPGPTKDYYYANGNAHISQASMPAAGQVSFSSDNLGRSGAAKASLTYDMFKASSGSRQGTPLDPPTGWPSGNPEITISYAMANSKGQRMVYHGYMWNRSHSIGDSLAGTRAYASANNFTSGTRAQNVGADQHGGMRAAEEIAENYWKSNPDSTAAIYYQTTPLYNENELIPRGSVVDILSTDSAINTEIVVINDAEGWALNYFTGESTPISPETPPTTESATPPANISEPVVTPAPTQTETPTTAVTPDAIKLISLTSPVSRGETAKVSVVGAPNTEYTISVYYSAGASTASGLEPKTSDAGGNVSWSWKIGSKTAQTSHYLVISGGGQSLTVDFTVR